MEERHEIIEFSKDSPVKFFLHRLGNVNRHWHNSIEILFVLNGTLQASVDRQTYTLGPEDVLLINSNSLHSLSAESCELVAYLVNSRCLESLPFLAGMSFHCVSSEAKPHQEEHLLHIRQLLARLLKINEAEQNPILTMSVLYELFDVLRTHFQAPERSSADNSKNLEKLSSLTDYILKHYRESITLNELAEHAHFSVSYLSRFFKENMGMNFTDYYNSIRLDHAVSELMTTNHSIAAIASKNGFSDVRTFVSVFKKQYRMLPSEYRSTHPVSPVCGDSLPEINYLALANSDALHVLAKYLKKNADSAQTDTQAPRGECIYADPIQADREGRTLRHTFRRLCCVGNTHDLLDAGVQRMLTFVQSRTPYEYIRFHGLFSNDTMVYDETASGVPVYRFTVIDQLFDFLLGIRLKPCLQLSFTPDALASDPDKQNFFIRYNTSAPRDFDRFGELLERLLRHLIARYGRREVLRWPIFLWNEPDTPPVMFGFPRKEDFFELYRLTYRIIRGVDPAFRIGTPTLMLFHSDVFGFSSAFFDFCRANDCMPDFINLNYYSDVMDFSRLCQNYETGISQSRLPDVPGALGEYLARLPDRAAEYGVSALPRVISEWNLTVNHRNLINDTCYKACDLAKSMLENYDAAGAFGYWSITDHISELQPDDRLFHGGMGYLTFNGIPKPHYFVSEFLFQLGDVLLSRGDGWFLTRDSDGEGLQLILYNYCHYSQLFSSGENFDMDETHRYTVFPKQTPRTYLIPLTGLAAPRYRMRESYVNREHGSVYDNWIRLGAPHLMSTGEVQYLRDITQPGRHSGIVEAKDGSLRLSLTLQPFEVRLVVLTPAEE